jgi:hypothetical protein
MGSDFIAAAVEHIPPKNQQAIRYDGRYSNKRRGWDAKNRIASPVMVPQSDPTQGDDLNKPETLLILPAPEPQIKPLWRDLILKTWGGDPLRCPCCKGTMREAGRMFRPEEIEFFLRLHGVPIEPEPLRLETVHRCPPDARGGLGRTLRDPRLAACGKR